MDWWYVPGEEERLVELVEDVDDEVVVGDGLDLRPRELVVDQDPLQRNAMQTNQPHSPQRAPPSPRSQPTATRRRRRAREPRAQVVVNAVASAPAA